MQFLARNLRRLVSTMNVLAAIAAILMTALVFSGAVMRYLVGAPLRFSDELVGLLFVAMAFLALPLGLLQGRHITIDIVTRGLRGPWRRLADLLAVLILIVFAIAFIVVSYQFASFSFLIDSRSEISALLLWPWMAIMPLCMAVALLVALVQLYDIMRQICGKPPLLEQPATEPVP
jgi:TRAP-type C4-dicarboxylate transport system permease small subunit